MFIFNPLRTIAMEEVGTYSGMQARPFQLLATYGADLSLGQKKNRNETNERKSLQSDTGVPATDNISNINIIATETCCMSKA